MGLHLLQSDCQTTHLLVFLEDAHPKVIVMWLGVIEGPERARGEGGGGAPALLPQKFF